MRLPRLLVLGLLSFASASAAYALSPYHTWREARFGSNAGDSAIAGEAADPDQDSLPNLFEYAAGLRPDTPDRAPIATADAPGISLTFTRDPAASDVALIVQGTENLPGSWTDLASSTNGAGFAPLVADLHVDESGGSIKSVVVTDTRVTTSNARFLRLKAIRTPTQTVAAVVQGQSNAVDMLTNAAWFGGDAGYQTIFKGLVRDLTGVPNVVLYGNEKAYDVGRRTAVGGTYLFKTGQSTGVWMNPNGPDASTWPLWDIGLECDNYVRTTIRGNVGDAPLAFLRIHSEYDGRHTTDAVYYAAANRNFVARMREAAGLAARQMPVFYGQVPYAGPAALGNDAVRSAWAADIVDPAMNARYAWGAANDGPYLSDNVHMGIEACRQAHARMAFAYARWLHDNGYANNDLSSLPTAGPRVASFRRGPAANQIDVMIQHDTGTDLVIPANVNLGAFSVSDPGLGSAPLATAAQRVNATTLRLTLDKNLSSSAAIKLDYLGYAPSPFANKNVMYGTGTLITDNYHLLAKPAHIALALQNNYSATSTPPAPAALSMPLRRLPAPLVVSP
jgi:hypothetical protein